MQCLQCERPAIGLCHICLTAVCDVHLAESEAWRRRSGALAGCNHASFDSGTKGSAR
jgi:hypothetical protein